MTVVGQLRSQGARWFGGSITELTINTGTTPTRAVHPEEAAIYVFKITAGAANLKLRMPYDVRNYTTGVFLRDIYVDAASTRSVELERFDGSVLFGGSAVTIAPGQSAIVFLRTVAAALGTWFATVRTIGGRAVHT